MRVFSTAILVLSQACLLSACAPSISIDKANVDETPLVEVVMSNFVVGRRQIQERLAGFMLGEMERTGCWEKGANCALDMGFDKCDTTGEGGGFVCLSEFSLPIAHRAPGGSVVGEEVMLVSVRAEFVVGERVVHVACSRTGTSLRLN